MLLTAGLASSWWRGRTEISS